jgi:hypothetical protein
MVRLQGRSILVVADQPDKYAQDYAAFLLDRGCGKILDRTYSYHRLPEVTIDYLVTENASRRKATWSATFYSRIEHDRFVVKRSWGECVPLEESEEKPPYFYATCDGKGFVIFWGENAGDRQAECVIYQKTLSDVLSEIPKPKKGEKVYAKVYLTGKQGQDLHSDTSLGSNDIPEATLAYLFEKLTGLPRDLYRTDGESRVTKRLESFANIRIVGTPEAVKSLSPN